MDGRRKSPDGLPLVSKETVEVFFRDYGQQSREGNETGYTGEIAQRVMDANPELGNFFRKLYSDMDPEKANHYTMGAGCLYEILRRQAEADALGENK